MAQSDDDTAARLTAHLIDRLPAGVREAIVEDVLKNPTADVNIHDLGKAVARGRQLNAEAKRRK